MENFNLTVHGVLSMPNLDQSEKLVLIQFLTCKSIAVNRIHSLTSANQLNLSKAGWLKINRRLMAMGITKKAGHGYYAINSTNLF